ncbi:MAG: cupin domain-containing protein [Acidobacteriota bacterium]|jgi:mannose-6-phosphate isomerase-like protein (cupin superfamily)
MKNASRRKFLPGLLAPLGLMAAPPIKLPDFTYTVTETTEVKESFGLHRKYFEGPTGQLKLMVAGSVTLHPGATPHPPHSHEEEEIMVVTEGTGIIGLNGQDKAVGPGTMMYSAANKPHDIRNTGKTPLTFYYYKWKA